MIRRIASRPNDLTRRETIGIIALGGIGSSTTAGAAAKRTINAIAFDAFAIFDPRSVMDSVRAVAPEHGPELAQAWSAKLFSNTWLYTAAREYAPFEVIAANSLRYAAESLGLNLSNSDRRELLKSYSSLEAWPDVKSALRSLRRSGIRLALLSNLSESVLRSNMIRNGLSEAFDHVLSTDRVRAFKPSPKAYAMALDAFGLPKSRIGFAAFAGWDAAGATWFGYRTAWVNRLGLSFEEIPPGPAIVARDISAVRMLASGV